MKANDNDIIEDVNEDIIDLNQEESLMRHMIYHIPNLFGSGHDLELSSNFEIFRGQIISLSTRRVTRSKMVQLKVLYLCGVNM